MEIITKDVERLARFAKAYKKVASEVRTLLEAKVIDHYELKRVNDKCEKYREQINLMIRHNFFEAVSYFDNQWVLKKNKINGYKNTFVYLEKNQDEKSIVKFNGSYTDDIQIATKFKSKEEAEELLPSLEYNIFREVISILAPKKEK